MVSVLDIPSEDYLDSLFSSQILNPFKSNHLKLEVIAHFSNINVIQHKKLQHYLNEFDTKHLLMNDIQGSFDLIGFNFYNRKMSSLFPQVYLESYYTKLENNIVNLNLNGQWKLAENNLKVVFTSQATQFEE